MKKYLLLICILALTLGLFAAEVIIGTGTTVARFPLGSYWGFERSAALYTADQIGPQNSRISQVAWYTTVATSVAVPTKIYMKTHGASTLTTNTWANMISGATLVYDQTQTGLVAGGWNLFALSSTFDVDSGSNLLILVERNYGGTGNGTSAGAGVQNTSNTLGGFTGRHLTWNADTTPPAGNGTVATYLPNVTLTYTTYTLDLPPNPAVASSPANNATNVAINATLNWGSGGGGPTGYKLYFGTSATPPYIGDLGNVTTYNPGALNFSTTYYWQVIPYNTYGDATGSPIWSFTTRPDPSISTFPWSVDFGTVAADWLPIDWTKHSGVLAEPTVLGAAGTGSWLQDDWLNVTTPPNKAAKVNLYGTSAQGWLISPPIQMPGAGYQLEFDVAYMLWNGLSTPPGMDGSGDRFEVLIGDGTSWTPANIVRSWDNAGSPDVLNNISPSGSHVTIDLAGQTGTKHIAFYLHNGGLGARDNDLMLDNVLIRQIPAGSPDVVTLNTPGDGATGLPIGGFNLTWTPAATGGTPTSYTVYLSQDEETIYDVYFDTTNTHFNPVTEGGLTFNYEERWYWTVEAVNVDGSAVVEPPRWFVIEADPTFVVTEENPFGENFDAVTVGQMPANWTVIASNTGADNRGWRAASNVPPNSMPNSAVVYYHASYAKNEWMITPPLSLVAGQPYSIAFAYKAPGWQGAPEALKVHWGTDPSVAGMTANTPIWDNSNILQADFTTVVAPFTPATTGVYYFGWHAYSAADNDYISVDDIEIRHAPPQPVLEISPEAWDFGTVQRMNPTTPKSFTLSNIGAGTIDILAGGIMLNQTGTDFVLVAENLPVALTGATTYSFTVQFIPQSIGPKTATVTIQDNLTRVIHTIELNGNCVEEPIASVISLQGTVEAQVNARLNWASVYGDPTQPGYVHWDDSIQRGSVGAGTSPFHAVAKYGTEITVPAAGKVLDGVMIHLSAEPQLITAVKVWTGTDVDLAPVTEVLNQAVSGLTVGWNYVPFLTPIPVTGANALYVGYYSTGMLDVFPGSTDGLTGVNGRGNLVELGAAWNTLTGYGIAGNWLIHAHFADGAPIMAGRRPVVLQNVAVNNVELDNEALRNSPIKARMNENVDRVLRGFNIYRDGAQINAEIVAAYTYLDMDLATDTYDYAVQAVHYSANGPISGTVSVTINPLADPIALPFTEDWASGAYATNMWTIGSTNWVIDGLTGSPAPSASFSWTPRVYDYSSVLASYEFDATGISSVQFSFDLSLDNFSTMAENTMTWEIWDGTAWQTLGSYNSLDDDLDWTRYAYDVSTHAANRVFKIRFVAAGEDSYEINYWYLDNIYLAELPTTMDPITDLTVAIDGAFVVLDWTAIPGASWYYVYASEDPYGTFMPLGYVVTAGAELPLALLPVNTAFVKVTAGTGPFPRALDLSANARAEK